MESTGKYWFPVHNILEKDFHVVVSHPKFVKAIKGKKTDKKDAMWIADLFKHDLVRGSFIPPEDIRQLRDLCRYYQKLVWNTTGEKNRAQNCLTVSNFKLDDVFSSVFIKSASAIISQLLEHPGEAFDVAPFLDKRCKASPQEVQKAIDGVFSPWQAEKLKVIRKHISNLDDLRDALQKLIFKLAEPYSRQIELLLTVPGISDPMTAIRVIAEIGADMRQFESSKHLCSWAGLTPQNNESANKKKTTRIGKAGQYLKPLLIQCAIAASNPRSKLYPEILAKYQILKKRRGAKKARVAIARRLLTAIFHILLNDTPYQPADSSAKDSVPEQRIISLSQAFALLTRIGYVISEVADISDLPLVESAPSS